MPSPSQRATVRDAMNRLQKIHQACTNQAAAADNSSAEKQSASFQDLARMIAENIQTTKDRIQQRNIMVQKSHALDHDVIVLSHSITKDIMLVEDKVTKLETMLAESDREYNKALSAAHKKYSKHKDPDDGTKLNGHDFVSSLPMQVRSKIEQLERTATERRNVCQSMRQCVIDLQELNSKRVNNEKKGKNTENMKSVDLLQNKRTQLKDLLLMKQIGADSAARGNAYKPAGNETASVSRLEEDSETKALMAEIKKNEAKMDASLDMLLQGVKRLGEHAKNIQRELGEQEVTIVEVSDKMEATDEKLNSLNERLKKITKSYQPTNMILTVGVIIILLGLIGYLVQDLIVNRGV